MVLIVLLDTSSNYVPSNSNSKKQDYAYGKMEYMGVWLNLKILLEM